jgi:hypothetical protein
MSTLADAIQAIRMGDRAEGRQILEELLEGDEGNEQVWLWLSAVVESDEDREVCLENVLALNPNNSLAQTGLNALRAGKFNPRDIISAALGNVEDEEEGPATGPTFLEEFQRTAADDEEDEGDLVMPSTMAKSKTKAGAKGKTSKKQDDKGTAGKGFKLNPRLIILAALVLVVICALVGIAASNLFFVSNEPSSEQTTQETPTQVEATQAPAQPTEQPTEAPTAVEATAPPPPTDTPVPTKPKLVLPTAKPTDLPTPTATQVVAPTP